MTFSTFSGGAAGANANLNNTYEYAGVDAGGLSTLLTGNVSGNTKGSASPLSAEGSAGVTANAWAGFWVYINGSSAGSTRWLIDISFDNSATWAVSNLYAEPGAGATPMRVFIPLNVPAGSTITARAQASASSSPTVRVGLKGVVRNASSPPLFTTMASLTADTSTTRASSADISTVASGSTTWATVVASTAATYGELLAIPGSGTTVTTAELGMIRLGVGAAASEVELAGRDPVQYASALPSVARSVVSRIERSVASGLRISAQFVKATAGETMRLALYGFA